MTAELKSSDFKLGVWEPTERQFAQREMQDKCIERANTGSKSENL